MRGMASRLARLSAAVIAAALSGVEGAPVTPPPAPRRALQQRCDTADDLQRLIDALEDACRGSRSVRKYCQLSHARRGTSARARLPPSQVDQHVAIEMATGKLQPHDSMTYLTRQSRNCRAQGRSAWPAHSWRSSVSVQPDMARPSASIDQAKESASGPPSCVRRKVAAPVADTVSAVLPHSSL